MHFNYKYSARTLEPRHPVRADSASSLPEASAKWTSRIISERFRFFRRASRVYNSGEHCRGGRLINRDQSRRWTD
jgi:hypothetical protein